MPERESGVIYSWTRSDHRGLIRFEIDGNTKSVFFREASCDPSLQAELRDRDIPPPPEIPVTFELDFQSGNLVAVGLSLRAADLDIAASADPGH